MAEKEGGPESGAGMRNGAAIQVCINLNSPSLITTKTGRIVHTYVSLADRSPSAVFMKTEFSLDGRIVSINVSTHIAGIVPFKHSIWIPCSIRDVGVVYNLRKQPAGSTGSDIQEIRAPNGSTPMDSNTAAR